ncbi:MAG: MbcA/ParS/Xre antitoxin family protein [Beijerinckiaceae bacterium]|nr:MbcA/ParS/Xre antitoxin family protein [Beijerinckiaceae bacterium]
MGLARLARSIPGDSAIEDGLQIAITAHATSVAGHKLGVFDKIGDEPAFRLLLLSRIYVALRTIFTNPDRAHRWMQQPNSIFQGQRPIDFLGPGGLDYLRQVRAYLEAEAFG